MNAVYKLSQDNTLSLTFRATTDKKTVVNLTNHIYFNLGGYASGKIFDHEIWMDAESFLETDESSIPTGRIIDVRGTALDFSAPKTIGRDFDISSDYLRAPGGFDHCVNFVKRVEPLSQARVRVYERVSGRLMEIYTDQPCVHFYTGNYLNGASRPFKGGYPQEKQNMFCLEDGRMPDSVNHENFTDCTLDVGKVYLHKTIFKFSSK